MSTSPAVKTFFSFPAFAVVGATSDQKKFGHKVFLWYKMHGLPVTPINPTSAAIATPDMDGEDEEMSHPTVPTVAALASPETTAVSIVTPPRVTLQVLREAAAAGVPAVWLQPGTYDAEVLEFAREAGRFQAVVAGRDRPGAAGRARPDWEGWCVLVDGEDGLRRKAAGKM